MHFAPQIGQYEQAVADYTRAIALDPRNANAYHNRGSSYDKMGRLVEAVNDFSKAIELDPRNASSFNSRGLARDKCVCVWVGGCGWVRVVVVASIVWCVLHLVPFHGSVFISCVGCRFFDLLAPLSRLSGDVHSDWDHVRRRWRTSHKPLALTGKVLCFGTIEGTA